jgi:hypothetical protein
MKLRKEHVLRVMETAHLPEQQRRQLLALEYPAELDDVRVVFESAGVYLDTLVDRMGGSP